MKTFKEHILEKNNVSSIETELLLESLKSELSEEEKKQVDEAINRFVKEYGEKNKGLEDFNKELTNEGFLGSILGGLTGFALGSSVGKIIANVLGIEKGVIYDLLTSRLVGAALGAALGKRI